MKIQPLPRQIKFINNRNNYGVIKMLKKTIILIFIFSILLSAQLFAQQVLDKVVAVVEDEIILQSELAQFTLNLAYQMGIDPRKDVEQLNKIKGETLQNLINQKILLARAEEDSIVVEERQVDSVLEEQVGQMIQRVGSEEELEKQLGQSIQKIKRSFREDVRKNLKVDMLRNTKFMQIKIARREVEQFYNTMKDSLPQLKETVDVSHILINIKPGEQSELQARQKAEGLLERQKKGEDFITLCSEYSEDPGSKSRGGELGFIQRGDFVPEFEEVAFLLQPGDYSDIVKTRFGFHIIQCIGRKGDKINVRHLLILLQPNSDDETTTINKINDVRKLFDNTEADFAEIAKAHSDDETTKDQGGHLGLLELENLQEQEFKNAIEELEVGEVSQPFKTKFGWHVLKLNAREEAREIKVEKDWDKIEAWALNIKRQNEFQKWLEEIKKDVYVDIKATDSGL
jgi:peptidyl-prolyl cis-trans isomerase SurA